MMSLSLDGKEGRKSDVGAGDQIWTEGVLCEVTDHTGRTCQPSRVPEWSGVLDPPQLSALGPLLALLDPPVADERLGPAADHPVMAPEVPEESVKVRARFLLDVRSPSRPRSIL